MKQTVVEWLAELIECGTDLEQLKKCLPKAKEMDKEQHKKTFKQAQECAVKADGVYFKYESFEQYYNETFKSE